MQRIKGIAIAFVAGIAVAVGAILLMRDPAAAGSSPDAARMAEMDAQIKRLERVVSSLSVLLAANMSGAKASPDTLPDSEIESPSPAEAQVQAVAEAEAMVDRGLQSGQWSRQQQRELALAVANMDEEEAGRIMARISAAINADQLQVDLSR